MGLTDRRERLLDTDRWRALGAFVERWYERPLSDADGHAPLEIERVARRLGTRLPVALMEWYELVGRRLRAVQDSPTRLGELTIADGFVRVWSENQGVWSIVTLVEAGDDPLCLVDDDSYDLCAAPLSQTVLGMLVSDTLAGAWGGTRVGALGELRATVRGGYCDDYREEQVQQLRAAYEELDYIQSPFFDQPYRGEATTILRLHEVAVEWITATDEAFAVLDDVFTLVPQDGEHELVVAFDSALVTRQDHLRRQLPDLVMFRSLLAGVGHLAMAETTSREQFLRLHVRTKQPRRVLELILPALPADLLPHVTVATRPVAVSVFEVLYPDTKSTFVLPH